jgi:hypothetical protein
MKHLALIVGRLMTTANFHPLALEAEAAPMISVAYRFLLGGDFVSREAWETRPKAPGKKPLTRGARLGLFVGFSFHKPVRPHVHRNQNP